MVFHVTAAQAAGIAAFELLEEIRRRFAEDVHQHVQAPAVRHADHDLLDTLPAGVVDQLADQRYQAFSAFQRKALLPDIFCMQVAFDALGRCQPGQQPVTPFVGQIWVGLNAFQPLLDPAFLGGFADVHVFRADRFHNRCG